MVRDPFALAIFLALKLKPLFIGGMAPKPLGVFHGEDK